MCVCVSVNIHQATLPRSELSSLSNMGRGNYSRETERFIHKISQMLGVSVETEQGAVDKSA